MLKLTWIAKNLTGSCIIIFHACIIIYGHWSCIIIFHALFLLQENKFDPNAKHDEIPNVFFSKHGDETVTIGMDILSKPIEIMLNGKKVTRKFLH